jgi:PAS domain-containing protein
MRDPKPSHEDLEQRIRELERVKGDLQRSVEALNASKQRFRTLFNGARDMVFIHGYTEGGMPGPFREVNEIACLRLGYTLEEL